MNLRAGQRPAEEPIPAANPVSGSHLPRIPREWRDVNNTVVAQSVTPLDEAQARRLTDRIKLLSGSVLESLEKLTELVAQAREGNAHAALGYRSWTEYVAAEFPEFTRLERGDRQELVTNLADAGMPTRAIASVVGVSQSTVDRDLTPTDPSRVSRQPRQVTGMNGKTYTVKPKSEPSKPRRRPLPDAYWDAVYDLQKAVERLERLHRDDRFTANRDSLARYHNLFAELSGRTVELGRHLLGADDELGKWKDRGRAKYVPNVMRGEPL